MNKVFEGYEDLTSAHEELMTMDEELNQQYEELEKHRNALMISNQRYELVIEGANDGIWDWDLKTDHYFFSLKWKSIFGYTQDELSNTFETWKQLLHPEDRKRSIHIVEDYLASAGGIYENTYRLRCKDGQFRWILSRGKGVWDDEGNPIRLAGSHTDITEQLHLQEFLRREQELSENLIQEAPLIILVLDKVGRIIRFNPFAEKITGYQEEQVVGKDGTELLIPKNKRDSMIKLFGDIIKGKSLRNNEIDIVDKTGKAITVLWNNNLLHDHEGNIQGIVSIGMDISDRKEMESKLENMAYYDSLTHLPNRTFFEEEVNRQINTAQTQHKKMIFIYLDIDNFKHINDTMGHAAGDQLIVYIAAILMRHIDKPDLVARVGGDGFGIMLYDIQDAQKVILKMDSILEAIRKPWVIEKQEFFISVSIGAAIYPEHGTDLAALMQNADTAMFHVKDNGKDGFCIFSSEMREKTWQYIRMSNQLRSAINNKEFSLYYQPQIDLKDGSVVGIEALIRWIHPKEGFIPPMAFIPFAEEAGYITQIEEWVFQTACEQKKKWERQGYRLVRMCINLSSKMLMQEGVVEKLKEIFHVYDINCSEIELEITETAVIVDLDRAIEVLKQLKALGIHIALDDFGTGYSSLTYLQKLPIDRLKVDREFIKNIRDENEESYIFKLIIDLAHNLGLKVVAEGVETEEQLAFLKKNNCDIGQGYHFSRPVPREELERFLRDKQ